MLDRRELGLAGKTLDLAALTLCPTTASPVAHLCQIKAVLRHLLPGDDRLEVEGEVVAHTQHVDGGARGSRLLLQLIASG